MPSTNNLAAFFQASKNSAADDQEYDDHERTLNLFGLNPSRSNAVDSDDLEHFENSTYKLKRTRSVGLLDSFITPTKKLIEEDFSHTNHFATDPLNINLSKTKSLSMKNLNHLNYLILQEANNDRPSTPSASSKPIPITHGIADATNEDFDGVATPNKQNNESLMSLSQNSILTGDSPIDSTPSTYSAGSDNIAQTEIYQPHDDNDITFEPKNRVDYFSYDWTDREILKSWRYVVDRKRTIDHNARVENSRLENASWRTWARAKYCLKTVTPESINWKKDIDVSWLYGPKCTPETESDVRNHLQENKSKRGLTNPTESLIAGFSNEEINAFIDDVSDRHNRTTYDNSSGSQGISHNIAPVKPILKQRKISEKINANTDLFKLNMLSGRNRYQMRKHFSSPVIESTSKYDYGSLADHHSSYSVSPTLGTDSTDKNESNNRNREMSPMNLNDAELDYPESLNLNDSSPQKDRNSDPEVAFSTDSPKTDKNVPSNISDNSLASSSSNSTWVLGNRDEEKKEEKKDDGSLLLPHHYTAQEKPQILRSPSTAGQDDGTLLKSSFLAAPATQSESDAKKSRRIHFNTNVDQCRIVDYYSDSEEERRHFKRDDELSGAGSDSSDNSDSDSSDNEGGFVLKVKTNPELYRKLSANSVNTSSSSATTGLPQIIERLPPANIRFRNEESSEESEFESEDEESYPWLNNYQMNNQYNGNYNVGPYNYDNNVSSMFGKRNAMSHNVNTNRGYEFYYDYNSVYVPEDLLLNNEYQANMEDVPKDIALDSGLFDSVEEKNDNHDAYPNSVNNDYSYGKADDEDGEGFVLTGDEALSLSSEDTNSYSGLSFGGPPSSRIHNLKNKKAPSFQDYTNTSANAASTIEPPETQPLLTKKPSSANNLSSSTFGSMTNIDNSSKDLTLLSKNNSFAGAQNQPQRPKFSLLQNDSDSEESDEDFFDFSKRNNKPASTSSIDNSNKTSTSAATSTNTNNTTPATTSATTSTTPNSFSHPAASSPSPVPSPSITTNSSVADGDSKSTSLQHASKPINFGEPLKRISSSSSSSILSDVKVNGYISNPEKNVKPNLNKKLSDLSINSAGLIDKK